MTYGVWNAVKIEISSKLNYLNTQYSQPSQPAQNHDQAVWPPVLSVLPLALGPQPGEVEGGAAVVKQYSPVQSCVTITVHPVDSLPAGESNQGDHDVQRDIISCA